MNARNEAKVGDIWIGLAACLLLLGAVCPAWCGDRTARACPACLGDICFTADAPLAAPLLERYGPGIMGLTGSEQVHCYRDAAGNYWAWEEERRTRGITDLFVSRTPTCKRHGEPAAPLPAPRTKEGLALGDPYARMIQLYGPPEWEQSPPVNDFGWMGDKDADPGRYGDKMVIYSTAADMPERWVRIYLRGGKVSAIQFQRTH